MRWPLQFSTPVLRLLIPCALLTGTGWALPAFAVQPEGAAASTPGRASIDLATAEALLTAGEAVAAGEFYAELTRRFPGLIEAHRGLSRALAAQGKQRAAAAGLRRLGEGLMAAGRYRVAVEVLRDGVELDPRAATLRVALGRALMLDQHFGGAAEQLAVGLELGGGSGPGVAGIQVYLGLAQWESGQVDEAEATLRAVAQTGSALGRHQLGRVLLWKGSYDEAITLLATVAEARPASADAQLDWARALEGAGELAQALVAYERVIELAEDRYPPHYNRARLLMRLGRREEAEVEMARYHRLYSQSQERLRDEGRVRARLDRGWELLAQHQPLRAEELFARLGDHVDALVGLSLARSARGLHMDAVASLERAVTLAPDRQDLRLMLAEERQLVTAP